MLGCRGCSFWARAMFVREGGRYPKVVRIWISGSRDEAPGPSLSLSVNLVFRRQEVGGHDSEGSNEVGKEDATQGYVGSSSRTLDEKGGSLWLGGVPKRRTDA